MGFFDRLEKRIEGVVRGTFSRAFVSALDPVEIISAVKTKIDGNLLDADQERKLAPHKFEIMLSKSDFDLLCQDQLALTRTITTGLKTHIESAHYAVADEFQLAFGTSPALAVGELAVSVISTDENIDWIPVIETGERRETIGHGKTRVGRGSEAEIQITDAGLSRLHFELLYNGQRAGVRDLGSTNGTFLNGVKFHEAPLVAGDIIRAGETELVFHYLPTVRGKNE